LVSRLNIASIFQLLATQHGSEVNQYGREGSALIGQTTEPIWR